MILTSHLPWLLHLLLLTEVGCAPDNDSSDRAVGANIEGSENLSATTVQHIASSGSRDSRAPDEGQWEAPRSADSHSVKHERLSISMASNATDDEEKVILYDRTAMSCSPVPWKSLFCLPLLCVACNAFWMQAAYLGLVHACQGPHTGISVPEV